MNALRTGCSFSHGPPLGSLLQSGVSSRLLQNSSSTTAMVLVVPYVSRHPGICRCLLTAKHHILHQLVFSILCPFLIIPGHTSLWILSADVLILPSDGNITILTIVDRFSKTVHFVPLVKLSSALGTAQLLISHIFLYFPGHRF